VLRYTVDDKIISLTSTFVNSMYHIYTSFQTVGSLAIRHVTQLNMRFIRWMSNYLPFR